MLVKKLTIKQDMFVKEYLKDLNGTQAAIRAGYSKKTANRIANQNLSKPDIRSAIEKAKQERTERTKIDADYVLTQTSEFLDYCFGRKPIKKTVVLDGVSQTIEVKEFNPTGIGKALELLGKHVAVQAFREKQELTATVNGVIDAKVTEMKPEERLARIKELQIKMGYDKS